MRFFSTTVLLKTVMVLVYQEFEVSAFAAQAATLTIGL
jgi:hypothetical protein